MAENPFSITPVNPLQSLMLGQQGYDAARGRRKEDDIAAGRLEAAQIIASGDHKGALARLMSVGDMEGAKLASSITQQEAQQKLAQQQLSESSRHNRATEGIAQEGLNKPVSMAPGSELVIPSGPKAGTVVGGGSTSGKLDDPTIDAMARQLIAGDTSVLTNLGRGAQGAENVIAVRKKVAAINAGVGESGAEQANRNAEFMGAKAGQRTLGTKQANIELAATEFKQVLPVVQEASKTVSRTNFPDLNKIIQAFETKTGDPNIVRFGGGINTLVNLYARAISPSGTPTVHDKEHARELLSKAWSQGQFDAAVGMMTQEIDAALTSPEKVREDMRKRFMGGAGGQKVEPTTSKTNAEGKRLRFNPATGEFE